MITISENTALYCEFGDSAPISKAVEAMERDFIGVFGCPLKRSNAPAGGQLRILKKDGYSEECFSLSESESCLVIAGSDDLGIVFGIYYFTEHILGVGPFAFWTDSEYLRRSEIIVKEADYRSIPIRPRFRGWFINDEDCLTAWDDSIVIGGGLWAIIFETLLRSGNNTVIPGTSSSPGDPQIELAAEYGLWIAQHHAEPLGAEMFQDAYPGVRPLLPEQLGRFESLYRMSVEKLKGCKVIWTLGFRGQGDKAFFEDDPQYDTDIKRGKLIESMVSLQRKIVEESSPGPHYFAHYIYAENTALYESGHLSLPNDIIRVFSDNGFGAMRARRHLGLPEPGRPSRPSPEDAKHNKIGIYYHVSFHDLEISNKIAPLIHPEIIVQNLAPFESMPGFDLFICNAGNIRPHVFHLGLLSELWNKANGAPMKERAANYIERWTEKHFPGFARETMELLLDYFDAPFSYNDAYPDAKAGEQVYHHGLRTMALSIVENKNVRPRFSYIPVSFSSNADCFSWLRDRAAASLPVWKRLCEDADRLSMRMSGEKGVFFNDNIGMHIRYMAESCKGFVCGTNAILAFGEKQFKKAFCLFYRSKTHMRAALEILQSGEHDKWKNFYRGDWLTGTRKTIRYLDTMLSLSRMKGDDGTVNSAWMIEALNLKKTAIATLSQAYASDDKLAAALEKAQEDSDAPNLSILA